MKLVVTAQAQTLPDDVYLVELVDVQEQQGAYGEQFMWQLRIAEGDFSLARNCGHGATPALPSTARR